jgi:phosphinothricin acetyltransferase
MTETELDIRGAVREDAVAIASIYNEGIRQRVATFEVRERTSHDVLGWLDRDPHPVLVAAQEGDVLGWIAGAPYRPRACYAGITDFSVYVRGSARRRGIGDSLMSAFAERCLAAGLWKIVGRIFPENEASLALCRRHGFRVVGVYHRHGRLDGAWRDVVLVERLLGDP